MLKRTALSRLFGLAANSAWPASSAVRSHGGVYVHIAFLAWFASEPILNLRTSAAALACSSNSSFSCIMGSLFWRRGAWRRTQRRQSTTTAREPLIAARMGCSSKRKMGVCMPEFDVHWRSCVRALCSSTTEDGTLWRMREQWEMANT